MFIEGARCEDRTEGPAPQTPREELWPKRGEKGGKLRALAYVGRYERYA